MRSPVFKRVAVVSLAALLLIVGYYWMHRTPVTSTSASPVVARTADESASETAIVPDTSAIDTVSAMKESVQTKPVVAAFPNRIVKPEQSVDRPAASAQQPTSVDVPEKPAPVACDQLVMRDGDLIDANVLEIGVNEIRYRKCRRDDGPDYVVSKSEVLSIRYSNGDVDRF